MAVISSIPTKESLSIEFKSDQKTISESVIVDEVVALANTDGGELYIGVEDDGVVTGVQTQHRDTVRMQALIANKTVPPVSVRCELLGDGEHEVMKIEVPRSQGIVATSSGRILRRRVKTDKQPESVPMYPYEITTRLSDLGKLDFSAQPITDADENDLDPLELERLRETVRSYKNSDKSLLELSDEEIEKALKLTVSVGNRTYPTLTGMLMVGRTDSLERLVPTHEAMFQVLQGTDVRANKSYRRPLLYTIEKIIDSIDPWNPVTEVSFGLVNDPVPMFNGDAVREAVVNAFGHRDYSVLGAVRVLIDDDGLTVSNPGGFIEGISIGNLLTADPHGRNPCLMDALKRVGLAERTGRGIDRIYEGSLLYGRPLPDYTASNSTSVRLFIARSEPDARFARMLADERARTGRPLSIQSLLILETLKRLRRATMDELASEVDAQPFRLKQTVESLLESGLIEVASSGRSRAYMLSARVYASAGMAKEYVRQTDINKVRYPELIMSLAKTQGSVTTADVAELLHADKQVAYYEIKKLTEQGLLHKTGAGRATRYSAEV